MLTIYFTIDVEIWCGGWKDLDSRFADAFKRYVYGPGGRGGLKDQLQILSQHGHKAICFVEPLFSARFGSAALDELVGLVLAAGHEVQLHLHTEWADEARVALLPTSIPKRQHLRMFSLDEQKTLLDWGLQALERAGAPRPIAFRAGNFGFNADTLTALAELGIAIDSSYNCTIFGPTSGVSPGSRLTQATEVQGVLELPMTVFHDGLGLRHTQLTACSWSELEWVIEQADAMGMVQIVLLSHNFELLTRSLGREDPLVRRRLVKLARFVERERPRLQMRGFIGHPPVCVDRTLPVPTSTLWRTAARYAEQAARRVYQIGDRRHG